MAHDPVNEQPHRTSSVGVVTGPISSRAAEFELPGKVTTARVSLAMTERARFATASPGDKELLQRPPEEEHRVSPGASRADSLRKARGSTGLSGR
jgi:hypothetical protein